jgi:hypothetical protein
MVQKVMYAVAAGIVTLPAWLPAVVLAGGNVGKN